MSLVGYAYLHQSPPLCGGHWRAVCTNATILTTPGSSGSLGEESPLVCLQCDPADRFQGFVPSQELQC